MTEKIVKFQAARDGGVMTKVNGIIAFPDRKAWGKYPLPQAGEEWEVVVCGQSPDKRVVFLAPVRILRTATETFKNTHYYINNNATLRRAQKVLATLRQCAENISPDDALTFERAEYTTFALDKEYTAVFPESVHEIAQLNAEISQLRAVIITTPQFADALAFANARAEKFSRERDAYRAEYGELASDDASGYGAHVSED